MAEFQKSKKLQGILFSKVTLLVLFVFSVILIIGLFDIVPKERNTNRNKELILDQLNSFKNQSSSLEAQIEKLRTDDGIEEKIREKFRVVKDGEGLVVIVDDQSAKTNTEPQKSNNFWRFLINLFK
ncbi:MAG TPA: septum formation initiator family protein [Candidatus Paceibacterota bacterium]